MTKTIVIGAYSFLGFHISNQLLQDGQEVIGVEWDEEVLNEDEEKELLFGRNDNFTFLQEQHIQNHLAEVDLICISLYDYFLYNDSFMNILDGKLEAFLSNEVHCKGKVILFLPYQVKNDVRKALEKWKNRLIGEKSFSFVYISELYGPWLSNKSPLLSPREKKRETEINLARAIFIDDFFEKWNEILTNNQKEITVIGEYQENWRADFTDIYQLDGIDIGVEEEKQELGCLIVPAKTSLRKGLKELLEHQKKIQQLKKWTED